MASTKSDKAFEISFDNDGYGSGGVRVYAVKKDDAVVPVEPKNKYGDAWYRWYYEYGEGSRHDNRTCLLDAYIGQEESCCGFAVLSGLDTSDDPKAFRLCAKEAGEEFGERLRKAKYKYMSAYVPDQKSYSNVITFLEAAGFKAGTSVTSNHGKYTNTRWEFQTKEVKREKAVSSSTV